MSRKADEPAPAVAIPGILAEFLENRSTVGCASSRDASLRPRIHWLSGWLVADHGRELVCLVSKGSLDGLLENLKDNGRFTATIEQIGPHETYQFKGKFLGSRPVEPRDRETWERIRERFAAAVKRVDPNLAATHQQKKDYIPQPEIAIRMRVTEVFLQTPGPGAGRRLIPVEGA